MDLPPAEQLLASAIHYLIQGDEKDAALVLLFCEANYGTCSYVTEKPFGVPTRVITGYSVHLVGPRAAYEAYHRSEPAFDEEAGMPYSWHPIEHTIKDAFEAVTPPGLACTGIEVKVQLIDITPGWREELQEIAHGRRVHNQGVDIPGGEIVVWGNLRFRSQSEKRIAVALDAVGVLFLPNCLARLNKGSGDARITKEADFLVCQNGKWGILEVDGPFHPRAATDHARDMLFEEHGIRVVKRFPAEDCYNDAPGVVRRFLTLLDKNG